ncbi:MAG: DNA adenine methylase [Pseudomonadota bacterium]
MVVHVQRVLFPKAIDSESAIPKPVNVASVPQRSPFRYPGGKTWFVPTFRQWITRMYPKPNLLVEPFVGGGIISLTALFEDLVDKVVMVELDEDIAAVWEAVVAGEAEWLADQIVSFHLTRETVIEETKRKPKDRKHMAFQTILKNRTFHGGILAEGAGFLKYGENGKGIRSRWYPATLAKRLLNLKLVMDRIDFRRDDGLKVLREFAPRQEVVYFIDPPYTAGGKKAGKRLYRYFELNHEELFHICEELKGNFLITYDNAEEVQQMARRHGFQMRLISMKNTHHAEMNELVIGKDLAWMDGFPSVHEPEPNYSASQKRKRGRKRPQ